MNILRSAAATNQVRLRIRHFHPPLSSVEYQQLLFEEKSTDDEEDHHHHHPTNNARRSTRRKHQNRSLEASSLDSSHEQFDTSSDALQALLNSRFKLIDLIDLVKKTYPKYFPDDQNFQLQFHQQLSETNPGEKFSSCDENLFFCFVLLDGYVTLKDFERQSSVLLGERINLLSPFYSSSILSKKNSNDTELVVELRRQVSSSRVQIDELQSKILTCERSQRLANEVELEYEDLLKYLNEQIRLYKLNEINHVKQIRANDQLIQKLFHSLSRYVNQPNDEHLLAQLKYEYEQQQRTFSNGLNNSMGS